MSWRPHGRASVDASNPLAFAICDRCGFLTNHYRLTWQYDWRGNKLTNTRLLVCERCLDAPNEGRRVLKLPADPPSIKNARVENYAVDEGGSNGFPPIVAEFWDEPGAVFWDDPNALWDEY